MKKTRQKGDARGQGLVEFALILPFLLMLMLGIMAVGHLYFTYVVNTASSREAARYGVASGLSENGVVRYKDCDAIRAAAMRVGAVIGVEDSEITVEYDDGPGTTVIGTCPSGGTGPDLILGQRVVVTVSIQYDPFFPLVNIPSLPMSSFSGRTIMTGLNVEL
jgi:Flp pilus assembly protein TadG